MPAAEAPATAGTYHNAVLSDVQWEALRLASIRGATDKALAREFRVAEATIRKRRSRDEAWHATCNLGARRHRASLLARKEVAPLAEKAVTASLEQIGSDNNLLAARFAHESMQRSVNQGLVSAPESWQEMAIAHKMVRTATGMDKEGTQVTLGFFGGAPAAAMGTPDPFEVARDVGPVEWI